MGCLAALGDAQSHLLVQASQIDRVLGRRLLGPAFRELVLLWPELAVVDQPELEPGPRPSRQPCAMIPPVPGALRRNDWVRVVATTK
jgi:hypothetical protein